MHSCALLRDLPLLQARALLRYSGAGTLVDNLEGDGHS